MCFLALRMAAAVIEIEPDMLKMTKFVIPLVPPFLSKAFKPTQAHFCCAVANEPQAEGGGVGSYASWQPISCKALDQTDQMSGPRRCLFMLITWCTLGKWNGTSG